MTDAAKNRDRRSRPLPVIAADLTTVAAFLPMLLVPGIMGDFMGVMPKVVSVALLGSVLVDHFIIPTLGRAPGSASVPVAEEAIVARSSRPLVLGRRGGSSP